MIETEIFTVYDVVGESFSKPFFGTNAASAIRGFSDVCKDPEHHFAIHPSDYALYHIGSFDATTGKIEALEPRMIAQAASFADAPSVRGPIIDDTNGVTEQQQVQLEGRA